MTRAPRRTSAGDARVTLWPCRLGQHTLTARAASLQRCGLLEGHGRTTCRVKSCRRPVWHRILLANGLPGRHRWASMCEQCQWCVAQISTTHYSHTQGRLTPEITIDSHTRACRATHRTRAPRRRDGRATRRAAETGSRDAPGDRRTDPDGMADGQTIEADQTPVRTRRLECIGSQRGPGFRRCVGCRYSGHEGFLLLHRPGPVSPAQWKSSVCKITQRLRIVALPAAEAASRVNGPMLL